MNECPYGGEGLKALNEGLHISLWEVYRRSPSSEFYVTIIHHALGKPRAPTSQPHSIAIRQKNE